LCRRLSAVNTVVEKEILIVVASLVHCCAIKNNVIVASQFYHVADVHFTIKKLLQFIQK